MCCCCCGFRTGIIVATADANSAILDQLGADRIRVVCAPPRGWDLRVAERHIDNVTIAGTAACLANYDKMFGVGVSQRMLHNGVGFFGLKPSAWPVAINLSGSIGRHGFRCCGYLVFLHGRASQNWIGLQEGDCCEQPGSRKRSSYGKCRAIRQRLHKGMHHQPRKIYGTLRVEHLPTWVDPGGAWQSRVNAWFIDVSLRGADQRVC